MKPDNHPEYDEAAPKWRRARDVVAGQDAVHKAGEEYLPRLKDQQGEEYEAYKKRATFFGATKRTVQALHGMVFRKAPAFEMTESDQMAELMADVTLSGIDSAGLSAMVTRECLEVGRCGVLVDFPPVQTEGVTVAQAQQMGARPFCVLYKAERIINWRSQRVNNRQALTMVMLEETRTVQVSEYETGAQAIIRVLLLREGAYWQEVWTKPEKATEWTLESAVQPLMGGKALPYIPFQFFGAEENSGHVCDPPLLDLVDLNLSHYRSTADVEHGAHFAGLPTAVISGYQAQENEKLYIGSATAWVFPNPDAKAEFLEFTGQGLGAIETRIKAKEQQMAVLGARMLAPDKAAAEASKTLEIRQSGEVSALAAMANTVSQGLTRVYAWLAEWAGMPGDVRCTLNTDYMVQGLSAQEITALVGAWQSGAISQNTLFYNLQQGEVIEQGVTFEDEEARIVTAPPSTTPQLQTAGE